uniref:Uncharacterized protein n=1 Tax=Candidozyma auris TaxID=498019 RepID=A0A0L0NQ76_CANAR
MRVKNGSIEDDFWKVESWLSGHRALIYTLSSWVEIRPNGGTASFGLFFHQVERHHFAYRAQESCRRVRNKRRSFLSGVSVACKGLEKKEPGYMFKIPEIGLRQLCQ